jgi:16S rRNA (uracil1498-N3)-methyltransferase
VGGVRTADTDQTRYLATVLRLAEGDPLLVFNGTGWEYQAAVGPRTPQGLTLTISGKSPLPPAAIEITLCQGLPKADKMDGIVRRATELGVARIVPFFAERSVPRWQPEQFPKKKERWQKIAVEASRQCGRPDIPEIGDIVTFERMIKEVPEGALRLIPWEEERKTGIAEVLRDPAVAAVRAFVLVIGPEGGFGPGEIEAAGQAGFTAVSLGERVLRVDTASAAALAILQYERGGPQATDPAGKETTQ